MATRFVIFDNRGFHISTVKGFLKKAGITDEIWPPENDTVSTWADAFEKLIELERLGWNPRVDCIILLLDLALEKEDDFGPGLEEVSKYSSSALEPYVRIAYTGWAANARERGESPFDSVIGKPQILSAGERAPAALLAGIDKAIRNWEARTGRRIAGRSTVAYRPQDSASARALEAAFGRDTLSAIIGEVIGEGWRDVRVTVMTGGYSGAYVLRIEGDVEGSRRSVICKISKERRILEEELTAWRRAMEVYSNFVGIFPPVDSSLRQSVMAPGSWFIVQSNVPGKTLIEAMLCFEQDNIEEIDTRFGPTLRWLDQYSLASVHVPPIVQSSVDVLRLFPIDVHRFGSSLDSLGKLRDQCVQRGYLADDSWHTRSAAAEFFERVVSKWEESLERAGLSRIPVSEQHGDLNPRNLILTPANAPQIIDWARFNFWPIGYDLTRLEMQILLRFLSAGNMSDDFPEELASWNTVWEWLSKSDADSQDAPLKSGHGSQILKRLRAIEVQLCERYQLEGLGIDCWRVLELNRTFDAIKICSYQDVADFKKLWFLLLTLRCGRSAGLLGQGGDGRNQGG